MIGYEFSGYNDLCYTPVPDEFFDFQMQDLSEAELKVLLYIFRRTFGFKKHQDRIAMSQFLTGIEKRTGEKLDDGCGLGSASSVRRGIDKLIERGYIDAQYYCPKCGRLVEDGEMVDDIRQQTHTDKNTGEATTVTYTVRVVPKDCPGCGATLYGREQRWFSLVMGARKGGRSSEVTTPLVHGELPPSFTVDYPPSSPVTTQETVTRDSNQETGNKIKAEICSICHRPKFTSSEHPNIKDICPGCESERELAEFFGERPERPPAGDNGKNIADPVQAGGGHSPAEAIVDGICRYNGLTQGIEALAEKDRINWVRKVAEICERYRVTTEQAKLAWRAYPLRFGFKVQVSPYYASFESEIAPLLAQARDGDITAESLRREEEGQEKPARGNGGARKGATQDDSWNPTQEQIERDRAALLARDRALAGGASVR